MKYGGSNETMLTTACQFLPYLPACVIKQWI